MIDILAVFITFFAVIDPIGSVPVFVAVTRQYDETKKRRSAFVATGVSILVLLFFVVAGESILRAMNIPLSAFRIAGGIILFLFAITMIMGESKPEEEVALADKACDNGNDTAIYPLAVPSLAGPGAILAAVLFTENTRFNISEQVQTFLMIIAVLSVALVLMLLAGRIQRVIGNSGASVISRVMGLILALAVGGYSYMSIPKEANPEIPLPFFYVSTGLDGISPNDAERLLLEPMETEFASIAGLESMNSDAAEGFASIQLEFSPGSDTQEALDKVREAADRAESNLPTDANDIRITEINTALFPIITTILSGPVPERTLNSMAEKLQEEIEGLEGVLEADIGGQRHEFLEVLIDPTVFQTYNLSFDELIGQIQRNNRLIAAGAIETGSGRIVLKVPGLIEDLEDVMAMPVKVRGNAVVTFGDVATIRRTFEDPSSFARRRIR